MNKNRAEFWISRRIRELEAKQEPPDQESMARAGMSYGDRQAAMKRREEEADNYNGELAALREVLAFIQEKA